MTDHRLRDLYRRMLHSLSTRLPKRTALTDYLDKQSKSCTRLPHQTVGLMALPCEMVDVIAGYLSTVDRLSLSLSCTALFELLFESSRESLRSSTDLRSDTTSLVYLLARDLLDTHSFCLECNKLHSLTIFPTPNKDVEIYHHARIPREAENLIEYRLRTRDILSPLAVPDKQICWTIRDEGLTTSYLAMSDDREGTFEFGLILIVKHSFDSSNIETLLSHIRKRRFLCPHLSTILRSELPQDWASVHKSYCRHCRASYSMWKDTGSDSSSSNGEAVHYSVEVLNSHSMTNIKWRKIMDDFTVPQDTGLTDICH